MCEPGHYCHDNYCTLQVIDKFLIQYLYVDIDPWPVGLLR